MKSAVLALMLGALVPAVAYAEPIPSYVLDKDFTSCMAGQSPAQDPQRTAYCNCIRDSEKNWTLELYGQVADAESKAHTAAQEPPQLQAIARACIAKIMH